MEKLNIAVLFGGCSPEYGVSLQSAYSVITHMDAAKYAVVMLGITQAGEWFSFTGAPEKIKDDSWNNPADCVKAVISPDRKTRGVLVFEKHAVRSIRLDAVFPVLHGRNGEDGTVQGLIALAGIPVIGCGALASALCMDKDRAHKIVSLTGIRVPRSYAREQTGNYPVFVKPVRSGSSLGISKVFSQDELPAALKRAYTYDDAIIIEESISGIEIGCAVLGNADPIVGELDEIEVTDGFFDYHEKYTLKNSVIHIPARITTQKSDEIKDAAKKIYKTLGCAGFARIDMFLTHSGEIVFSEVNTIPGFTVNSQYPKMMAAIGLTLTQILDRAVELAMKI